MISLIIIILFLIAISFLFLHNDRDSKIYLIAEIIILMAITEILINTLDPNGIFSLLAL